MAYLVAVAVLLLLAQAEEPLRVGNGVSPPRLLSEIEARKGKLNGTVVLYVIVRPDGHASHARNPLARPGTG